MPRRDDNGPYHAVSFVVGADVVVDAGHGEFVCIGVAGRNASRIKPLGTDGQGHVLPCCSFRWII